MNLKILITGSKGMAGHITNEFFKENSSWEILPVDREKLFIDDSGKWKDQIKKLNSEKKIDFLINFIGILKPQAVKDPILAMKINALFPHELANFCSGLGIKVIHISTDCFNDLDFYGKSKRAGELDYDDHLTIRTSIIGPELKSNGSGLFHWFMSQKGEAGGFVNHYWDGVTTLELAKKIKEILEKGNVPNHIIEFRTKIKVNKFELLNDIKNIFNKEAIITKKETEVVDKSNPNPTIVCEKSLKEQLQELKQWMDSHKEMYLQYY